MKNIILPQKECIREHPKPQYFLRASVSGSRCNLLREVKLYSYNSHMKFEGYRTNSYFKILGVLLSSNFFRISAGSANFARKIIAAIMYGL